MTKPAQHLIAVWTMSLRKTEWAWSCKCGARYTTVLPSQEAARAEAYAHRNAAERGVAAQPAA